MKVKRFFAPDMSSAMRLVRDEVGPDAVILSNNRVAGGVEVVVALEYQAPTSTPESLRQQRVQRERAREGRTRSVGASSARERLAGELGRAQSVLARSQAQNRPQQSDLPPLLRAAKDKQLNLDDDVWDGVLKSLQARRGKGAQASAPRPGRAAGGAGVRPRISAVEPAVPQGRSRSAPADAERTVARGAAPVARPAEEHSELQAMRDEIESLKSLLRSRLSGEQSAAEPAPEPVAPAPAVAGGLHSGLLGRFERMGVVAGLAQRLVSAIEVGTEPERGWKIALGRLAEALPTVGENIADRGGVLAFVGATGVGKTTTIGKLAAQYVLKHGSSSVALVTTDSYRIAAHEQLRTFGRILDIPVRVVDETRSLDDVLRTLRDKRLVLIDTSGIGSGDSQRDAQLAMLAESSYRIKKYLVLPTTAQYQVLKRACDHFKPVGLNGAVLSKVDESVSLGEAISVVVNHRLPVAYVTDGQKIPDHIEVARANGIVSRAVVMAERRQSAGEVDTDQQPALYAQAGDVV
ncbi:flagellar biosynthesis protein FlhF [Motiliproteus sp. SC1-56]|uniref:flagellar biosynthesis protein FlhF n=1 Tax=Motiliproteus sp. SC1-56 TaxID=2799565 RepID=UPI001A903FAC